MSATENVLCFECGIPVKLLREEGHRDRITCLGCGRKEDFDEAIERAKECLGNKLVYDENRQLIRDFKSMSHTPSDIRKPRPPGFIFG